MSAGMVLRAVRPMQRHVSSVPPRIDSPYVLRIAVDVVDGGEDLVEGQRIAFHLQLGKLFAERLGQDLGARGQRLADLAIIFLKLGKISFEGGAGSDKP